MKKLLPFLLLISILISGCISIESQDLKYEDPANPENYIVFHPQEHTFVVVTEKYIADGTYTEEGNYMILHYTGYPGAVSVKKTVSGLDIGEGIVWKRVA